MRKIIMLLAGLAVLAGFSGCSGSIADYMLEEQIRCLNDVAAAMENGAPDFKIYELKARAQEAGRKLGALNLTEAEKKSLGERHRGELERVRQRWGAAMLRYAGKQPGDMHFPGAEGANPLGAPPQGKQ